jgi:hypothetical protein
MISGNFNIASAGALAAELLAEACRLGPEDDLRLGTVRELAADLGRRLSSLVETPAGGTSDSLVEAALACADLATLAVCNVPDLPEGGRALGAAATQLAAGTTHALLALVGEGVPQDAHAENVSRDARSAGWKADLALHQIAKTV